MDGKYVFTGKVIDRDSLDDLIHATVRLLKNGETIDGTYTDVEGVFSIIQPASLPDLPGLELVISYVSYENDTLSAVSFIQHEDSLNIVFLKPSTLQLGFVGAIPPRNAPLHKRAWRRFKKLFRRKYR